MIPYPCTLGGAAHGSACVEPIPNADTFGVCSRTSNIGISNGGMSVSAGYVTSSVVGSGARVLLGRSSGKYYFEFTTGTAGVSPGNPINYGLCTAAATLGSVPTDSVIIENIGAQMRIVCHGTAFGTASAFCSLPSTPGIIGICIDFGAALFWAKSYDSTGNAQGRQWNILLNGDPATGTGGVSVSTLSSATLYPFIGLRGSISGGSAGSMGTFGGTNLPVHPAPSGFSSGW